MKTPKIYSRYNTPYIMGVINNEPSLTQQHFKDECDINTVLAKFVKTGVLDNIGPGSFADVSELGDYREALGVLADAESAFASLPSAIRKRFDNDPANYLDFVHNPANEDEGIQLGIFNPKPISEIEAPAFENDKESA